MAASSGRCGAVERRGPSSAPQYGRRIPWRSQLGAGLARHATPSSSAAQRRCAHGARRLRVEAGDGSSASMSSGSARAPGRCLRAASVRRTAGRCARTRSRPDPPGRESRTHGASRPRDPACRRRRTVAQAPLQHVLDGGGTAHQVVVLEHHGDAATRLAQRARPCTCVTSSPSNDAALRGIDQAVHAAQQRICPRPSSR